MYGYILGKIIIKMGLIVLFYGHEKKTQAYLQRGRAQSQTVGQSSQLTN